MFKHYTVLKKETIDLVINKLDGVYVDGTFGGGGHSQTLIENLSPKARVYSFDQDIEAIKYGKQKYNYENLHLIHANFRNLKDELEKRNIHNIDGLILDLGFSSPQIDDPKRGFSYMNDGPLDMRMNVNQKKTAHEIINKYTLEQLTQIFQIYGEEKFSKRIAGKIISQREEKAIKTTFELVEIIEKAIPTKFLKKIKGHSSKKIFQALRIEVNQELKVLEEILDSAYSILNSGGKMAIITFHSLEDKIVKYKYLSWEKIPPEIAKLPEIPLEYLPKVKILNKKPITPSEKELEENSRSQSAKLRGVKKI